MGALVTRPRHALLLRDLPTPIGIFAAGLSVIVLAEVPGAVRLCLDLDRLHRNGGRCHTVTVPWHFIAWARKKDPF